MILDPTPDASPAIGLKPGIRVIQLHASHLVDSLTVVTVNSIPTLKVSLVAVTTDPINHVTH